MNEFIDTLKLENQLCFPLYAASRETVKLYRPFLDELGLTYTQYVTMLIIWEYGTCSVKFIGEKLYLDSGTLTPVLKSLERKGLLKRKRSRDDERVVNCILTEKGEKLKEKAVAIPDKVGKIVGMDEKNVSELYRLLYLLLEAIKNTSEEE